MSHVATFRVFQRLEASQMQRLEAASGHVSPYSSSVARTRTNLRKNRYTDILPYDANRVKLACPPDYINASWVDSGYGQWIATQGPLQETRADFWEMVMQYSSTVVMLCSIEEEGRLKCAAYWPTRLQNSLTIRDAARQQEQTITCEKEHVDADSGATIRTLSVRIRSGDSLRQKEITHIHFQTWPDKDVTTIETLKSLLVLCAEYDHGTGEKVATPITVHCSAGCGRTGTLIAMHALLKDPRQDVAVLVDHLRKQRIASVQALSQFDLLCAFQAQLSKN